jgi:alkylated DNA repair dioxygenase AlkB
LRAKVAAFTGHAPEAFEQALISLYEPGAAIGWHRDRPEFKDVAGVSLLTPCRFRLRRAVGERWERKAFEAAPRSAYLLSGPSRTEWEHSIPPLEARRYSVTFRTRA